MPLFPVVNNLVVGETWTPVPNWWPGSANPMLIQWAGSPTAQAFLEYGTYYVMGINRVRRSNVQFLYRGDSFLWFETIPVPVNLQVGGMVFRVYGDNAPVILKIDWWN